LSGLWRHADLPEKHPPFPQGLLQFGIVHNPTNHILFIPQIRESSAARDVVRPDRQENAFWPYDAAVRIGLQAKIF